MSIGVDVTKASLRQQMWSFMEKNEIAQFPRPVFNRIPNYKGAQQACDRVKQLPEFQRAKTIKIDPDSPLKQIRYLTLEAKKRLFVPTPRLTSGLLNEVIPPLNATSLGKYATHEGIKHHSVRIGLDANIKIDLIIVGAVVVSMKGHRIGKGEGYSDLEYAMMCMMKAVNSETPIIAVVHDCQVLDSISEELFKDHDVPVDIIVTPTRTIKCQPRLKRPDQIFWPLLTTEKINVIPILKVLKTMEEKKL